MTYRKIVVLCMMLLFFCGFVFAQSKPETPNISITAVCSATPRTQATSQTYQTMYKPSDLQKKYFKDIKWDKSVAGAEARYDNTRSIQESCKESFHDGELGNRNAFWDTYFSIYKTFFSTNDNRSSPSFYQPANIGKIQSYIKWACGLDIATDGKLGKKTVNSLQVCKKPPAGGKLGRKNFESLIGGNALFKDEKGINPIYTGNQFVDGFDPDKIYIDLTKSNGLVTQDNALSKGLIPTTKTLDLNDMCRTDILKGVEQSVYDIMKTNLNTDKICCYNGPKKSLEALPPALPITLPAGWTVVDTKAIFTPTTIGLHLPIPQVSVCGTSSENQCRFTPPKEGTDERKKYDTEKEKLGADSTKIPTDCKEGCGNGYTEKKIGGSSLCEKCDINKCNCGVKLNTSIPFIGRCIMNQATNQTGKDGDGTTVNSLSAFPILMGALIKLLMSIIMLVCFASLIIGGFMMTVPDQYDTGKGIIKKVVRTIVSLGTLGTILYLINPNFFS